MSRGLRLSDLSADALRLTCGLLDSPLPPELARHYIALPIDAAEARPRLVVPATTGSGPPLARAGP